MDGDLPVGQHLSGTDGVAVAHLPGIQTSHLSQQVEVHLRRKDRLGHAEAAERACRRVVGVNGGAVDVDILVIVGACRMGTGSLEHRAA